MVQAIELEAVKRDASGTGASRAVRKDGNVPAIIYGGDKEPSTIAVNQIVLEKHLQSPSFFSHIFDIKIGNEKAHVLPRDVHLHPVTDRPLHVDFLRVTDKTQIRVDVPVKFANEAQSPGIKDHGGLLNIVLHSVEIIAAAGSIPEDIEVDLTDREVGDTLHLSDLKLPAGTKLPHPENDVAIATIAAARMADEPEPEAEAAEAAEPEVINQKSDKDGEAAAGEDKKAKDE